MASRYDAVSETPLTTGRSARALLTRTADAMIAGVMREESAASSGAASSGAASSGIPLFAASSGRAFVHSP